MNTSRSRPRLGTQPTTNDLMNQAEALAIEALDTLVGRLIRKNNNSVPPDFLDWVGTEATDLAMSVVRRYMQYDSFVERMKTEKAEVTILRVVYRAIMPLVTARYGELTENLTHYSPLPDLPSH